MLRRDVATALIASTAGVAMLPKTAAVQSSTPPTHPQTASELALSITPTNYQYPAYTPERYATNTTPGTTDMWLAIQTANNAAAVAGACVNFTAGMIYGVNCTANRGALTMSASWNCHGPHAIIRRIDFTTSAAYFTVLATQVAHLTLSGLIFDGQVTTVAAGQTPNVDLGNVGSYNDNSTESLWTQPYGVYFRQTQYCTVQDCVFMNFLRAGLRFDAATGTGPPARGLGAPWTFFAGGRLARTGSLTNMISLGNRIVNCRTQRTRGIFGDGFYTDNCENNVYVNCYAYDYQRIGFVLEFGTETHNYGTNGGQYVNCTADYGHDAVTSGVQSNVGFWIESGDAVLMTNCESKNTSVGWEVGTAANGSQGTFRPYTGGFSFTSCRAIRSNSCGFKVNLASRDAHVVFQGCFAEVNSTAATYSGSVGLGSSGFQISFAPAGSPPDGIRGVSCHVEIRDCHVDLVGMSGTSGGNPRFQAGAVNMWQGSVTNAQQLQVDITGLSTKWLTSAGALDTSAQTTYALTTGHNYGYFGDVIFTGVNNGGAPFRGQARIRDCTNLTTGYVMISSEISSANSQLEIVNTRCSLRTGGATTNQGILSLSDCRLVDYRGNIRFDQIFASGVFFGDADSRNTDRTSWGTSTVNGTMFYFTNCRFQRRMLFTLGAGTTSNRSQSLKMTGCEFFLQLPYSRGGESFITLALGESAFATIDLNGCAFRNVGGKSSATGAMIVNNSRSTLQINGAGNSYDNGYVSAGGHVVQYNNTPAYNDAPATAAAPFNLVNGFLQEWNAA